ncbi:endolysin [Vibrio phage D51]
MANKYGKSSKRRFDELHEDLQKLLLAVLPHWDHSVLCGYRDEQTQNSYYQKGTSRVKYPNSKHNQFPSIAVDVQPYPWTDDKQGLKELYMFIGFVQGIATSMGIKIRCGADWDGDRSIKDQNFHDVFHIELLE